MNTALRVPYIEVAPVATSKMQFVSHFAITTKPDRTTAKYLVLNIAVDSNKTGGIIEIPIFISATGIYPNYETDRMQQNFRDGDPFVAVEIENLQIYRSANFYGFGTGFHIINNPTDFIEEEDLL